MKLPKTLFTSLVKGVGYVGDIKLEFLMKNETTEKTIGEYQLVRVFKAKNETTIATRELTKLKKRVVRQPSAPDSPPEPHPDTVTVIVKPPPEAKAKPDKQRKPKKKAEKPVESYSPELANSKFLYKCVCGHEFDVPATKLNGKVKTCPKCGSLQITLTD
jgi:hypothetical protein